MPNFVGLGGNFGELEEITEFCKSCDIKVIVDAAHMDLGTTDISNYYGDITVYSFQAVKNLPTADSGMMYKVEEIMLLPKTWLARHKQRYI